MEYHVSFFEAGVLHDQGVNDDYLDEIERKTNRHNPLLEQLEEELDNLLDCLIVVNLRTVFAHDGIQEVSPILRRDEPVYF